MGETRIIALCEDEQQCIGHIRLMNKIAYALDESGDWEACRSVYPAVMVPIEMEDEEWDSNFRRFEYMIPRPVPEQKDQAQKSGEGELKHKKHTTDNKRKPDYVFCKEFQKEGRFQPSPHMEKYKDGTEVQMHHVCARCFLKNKEKNPHPETSEVCPLKGDN